MNKRVSWRISCYVFPTSAGLEKQYFKDPISLNKVFLFSTDFFFVSLFCPFTFLDFRAPQSAIDIGPIIFDLCYMTLNNEFCYPFFVLFRNAPLFSCGLLSTFQLSVFQRWQNYSSLLQQGSFLSLTVAFVLFSQRACFIRSLLIHIGSSTRNASQDTAQTVL